MPVTVVLLAGMGRSGTTLLDRVLSQVPGVVGIGELVHAWERGIGADELCGCGQTFSRCPFWSEVGERAFGGWHHVDLAEVRRLRMSVDRVRRVPSLLVGGGAGLTRDRVRYSGLYVRVYEAVAAVSGARIVVDSSKQASLPHVLAARPELDLRVIHCVRDARAVCYAWTKRKRRPEAPESASFMPTYRPRTMAGMWTTHNLAVELVRWRRTPVHRIRYEDFVDDVVGQTQRILSFAGVNGTGSPAATTLPLNHIPPGHIRLSPSHTAAGNPMRFRSGDVPIERDDAWRAAMPAGQRRLVTALTAPLLARYGYLSAVTHRG